MTRMWYIILTLSLSLSEGLGQEPTQPILIRRATLIDGTGRPPMLRAMILIEGQRIVAVGFPLQVVREGVTVEAIRTERDTINIPSDVIVYDMQNLYVIPGLIDAHTHYESPQALMQMLAWGVTSANCMFESTDQALEMESRTGPDSVESPRLYATAPVFTVPQGWWWGEDFPDDPEIDRFPPTATVARKQIEKVARKGITRVKLMYDDMRWCRDPLPPLKRMDHEVMRALIDESNRRNIVTEIHAPTLQDAREALAAGVSSFVHGILDQPMDSVFMDRMLARGVYYVPTSCVYEFLADVEGFISHVLRDTRFRNGLSEETITRYTSPEYHARYRQRYPNSEFVKSRLAVLYGNLRRLALHNANIVMGTDMWAFPGIGAHLEMEYMVETGLSPMQVLQAATRGSASFLGIQTSVGTVEPGKLADLVILRQNPLLEIRNTREIWKVMKQGVFHDHLDLIERAKR